jgi:hypothetical protein
MPRAQRTKSAVHEALQRRAGDGPGDGFSEELARRSTRVHFAFRTNADRAVRSFRSAFGRRFGEVKLDRDVPARSNT